MSRNPWLVQAIPFGSRFSPDLLKRQRLRPICYADIQYWRYAWLYRCWWVSSLDDRSNTSNAKHLSPSFKYWIWIFKYWELEFKLISSVIQYWKFWPIIRRWWLSQKGSNASRVLERMWQNRVGVDRGILIWTRSKGNIYIVEVC